MLPALVFLIIVTQVPMAITVIISFFHWNALYPNDITFSWFDNYVKIFTTSALRQSVITTIVLTVVVVLVSLVLGMVIALLLDRKFPGRGAVRTLMIAPFLIVPIA
jgi:sorbitol/mannitol transport system permease protein